MAEPNWTALMGLFKSKDPRAMQIAQNLTPEEQQQFFDFQKHANNPPGMDRTAGRADDNMLTAGPIGVSPLDLLAIGPSKFLTKASSIPGMAESELPAMFNSVRGGIGRVGEAVSRRGLIKGGLGEIMSMIGGAPGAAKAGVGLADDAAVAGANHLKQGMSDMNHHDMPSMQPDSGVNVIPRNMSTTRTPADVSEQVGRGVQNDFRGVAHIDPSATSPSVSDVSRVKPNTPGGGFSAFGGKSSTFGGSNGGADSLDQLLSGIHGPDVDLPPNGGVGSGGGFDPREIPPGVTRKSAPSKFKAAGEKFAVDQEDPSETARMQALIKSLLDRQRD